MTEKSGVQHDFSSTHVELPTEIANQIIKWGKKEIVQQDIYSSGRFGLEDEIHATVLYGIYDETPINVEKILLGERPIKLELGKITLFTNNPKFDVVKIEVLSPDLHRINKKLCAVDHMSEYPKYKPHVTIVYVKKGCGDKYDQKTDFEGQKATCDAIIFSSKNGRKTKITLKRN